MIATCHRRLHIQWRGIRQQSTSVKALLAGKTTGKDVTITGWINHKRKLKNATFLDITDGSTYEDLQIVAGTTPETYALIKIA
jgi:aspartyl/asparaginyl-tRNA synthetase